MIIERDEAIAQRDDFSARLITAENKLHAVVGALNTPTKNTSSKVCLAPLTPHHPPARRPPASPLTPHHPPARHSRTATWSTRMMARTAVWKSGSWVGRTCMTGPMRWWMSWWWRLSFSCLSCTG